VSLAVEQGGPASRARIQGFDVVRELTLEILRGIGATAGEHPAAGAVEQSALLSELAVLSVQLDEGPGGHALEDNLTGVALTQDFQQLLDSLPADWTDLEVDLRIDDENRYIDTATALTQINAQPYSKADWHWRICVAHSFGHAAAAQTVMGVLATIEEAGVTGVMRLREVREGRAEVVQMWGRPESVREEFRERRSL